MDVFTAVDRRYSYRGAYEPGAVPKEDLRRIVQAGIQAPSGCNAQTTSFVIADDPDLMHRIYDILPGAHVPPAMIVCIVDPRPVYGDMSFEMEDCAAAVENMLLAVAALGYATVWLDGQLRAERRAERLAELLGVPAGKRIQVVLPIGIAVTPGEQREKLPFEQRAWFNRYGG
jgi:nitroreductase